MTEPPASSPPASLPFARRRCLSPAGWSLAVPVMLLAALGVLASNLRSVYPAWFYRVKYYTAVEGQSDRVAAARRIVRANPFYDHRHALLLDMSQSAARPRLGLYDLRRQRCLFRTQALHGRGSGQEFARSFSNRPNSRQTSLGRYVVVATYKGRYGRAYRLAGLESSNDHALARGIVLHSSAYVRPGGLARSEGCPAVSEVALRTLRPYLREGTLLWIYR